MIKKTSVSSGFTLIELMVTMVLSSLFIGGIAQVFISTSKNFRTQRTLSYMMEDARFALDKLNSEFRRAGFLANKDRAGGESNVIFRAPDPITGNPHPNKLRLDFNFNGGTGVGSYNIRNAGADGNLFDMQEEFIRGSVNPNGLVSDVVVMRYQLGSGNELANNQLSPCTNGFALGPGELPPQPAHRHIIVIVFYVAFDPVAGSNSLYCKAFRENIGTATIPLNITQALNATPLISNVERLRVLYGESDGLVGTVYRTAAQVEASPMPNWARVRSVRFSLALRSEESNISVALPGDYILNGKLSIAPTNAAERRLYRVFTTTAAFRN